MKQQHLVIIGVVAAVLLLVGLGALLYGVSQGGSLPGVENQPTPAGNAFGDIPAVKITPPPSLAEIASQLRPDYPDLADLLENPELGSVYKDFYLAYQNGGEPAALALAEQRGILNDNDEIVITLVLDTEDSAPLIAELEAEGVVVQNSYRNLITIAIPVALIKEKAETEDPSLLIQRISNLEHVIRLELPRKASSMQEVTQGQGINVTQANRWHEQGITGQGVKVGVLDLGFGGYKNLLGADLPENVTVAVFGDDAAFDAEVHGTACAEIVHEMAPEAELYLAFYDGTDLAFGQAVEWLMAQDVDIITNSTGSVGLTPMDGTGFSADVVNEAHQAGIFWVNAAGNSATSHYRGDYQDSDGNNIHEFFPNTEVIPFIPFGPGFVTDIILSWNDWQAADQDYDLILTDIDGNVLAESSDYQGGQPGSLPAEGFFYEFPDSEIYLLSIENDQGLARGDATFDLFIDGGEFHPDYLVAEHSLSNPADARGAFAVGAVHWADDVLESYSSQGPTADGRIKPDIAAPSVVDSSSYAPEAFNGTSAAAPHVAGAAALLLQAKPELAGQPDEIAAFFKERVVDLGESGPDNSFGAGRISLGDTPVTAPQESEPVDTPAPEVAVRPTSTPRPAAEVGLPGQSTGLPGQSQSPANQEEEGSALVGFMVLGGLCLLCMSGLLFLGLIVGAVILSRRK